MDLKHWRNRGLTLLFLVAQRGVASELPVSFSGYGDFSFPSSFYFDNNPDKTDVPWLCRRPNCCQCQESVESTAVHSDCLKLFVGLYRDFEDGLRQLWVAATWRSPWRGAPALNLNPVVDIRAIAKVSGLGRLTSLPLELCAMIEGFSSPVSLQSCSVLELAQRLLASVKQKQLSIPLTKISHWDRGESPEADNDNHFRFIRIAIDSQGLWRIERLSERPQEGTSYTRHVKYVVEAAECFSNVVVDFAVSPSTETQTIVITNTESSLDLPDCGFHQINFTSGIHLVRPVHWNTLFGPRPRSVI